jgi:WD40 repeat protein/energy-coupling factor transporter ATP-binding protein EcfA2
MISEIGVQAGVSGGRFLSLSALKTANNELLKMRRENGYSSEFLAKIKEFVTLTRETGAVLNVDTERWAAQSLLDYWCNYLYRAGIKLDEQEGVLVNFDEKLAPTIPDSKCPYVGLAAFREDTHDKFFGRQKLIEDMCKRLNKRRFLAVIGPSGSGKSSLVMAGLVPALKASAIGADGDTPGSKDWRYFRRTVPGADPLLNLAKLIKPTTTADSDWAQAQRQAFMQDAGHLLRLINESGDKPALIFVDQFEEIFTLTSDETIRAAFISNLLKVVEYQGVRHTIVLTRRSDFEEYVTSFDKLTAESKILVTPLSRAELREAIVQPAERVGLKFEDGVVERLVNEVFGEQSGLPLLQFTLRKLWDERKQNLITKKAFDDLGGCRRALTTAADEVFDNLEPPDQERAKRIFLKLVRPIAGTEEKAGKEILYTGVEVLNNRLPRAELYFEGKMHEHIDRVIDKFLDAGLLRETETDVPGEAKIEVAHEALIRHWQTLNSWLIRERDRLGDRLRLADAAKLWDKRGRDKSALLTGKLLEEAQNFKDLLPLEEEFIKASSKRQRGLWLAVYITIVLIVLGSISFAILLKRELKSAIKAEQTAKNAEHTSTSRGLAAQSASNRKERLDLALLLSLHALDIKDTPEARRSLLEALEENSYLISYLHGQKSPAVELAFKDEGKTLLSANRDGSINFWNTETLQLVQTQTSLPLGQVRDIAYAPNRQTVAISTNTDVSLIDLTQGQPPRKLPLPPKVEPVDPISHLLFSPDGKFLAGYLSADDSSVVLWNVETVAEPQKLTVDKGGIVDVTSIAFSSDGKLIAAGTNDNHVLLWNLQTKRSVTVKTPADSKSESFFDKGVTGLAFCPRGNKILAAVNNENITLWDLTKRQSITKLTQPTHSNVTSLAFSQDGNHLAAGHEDHTVALWGNDELIGLDEPINLTGHSGSVIALAFSDDGTKLASSDNDKNVILWEIEKPQRLVTPLPPPKLLSVSDQSSTANNRPTFPAGLLSALALSPDGKHLAALTDQSALVLWDAAAKKPEDAPLAPPVAINQPAANRPPDFRRDPYASRVAFSPDNKTVAATRGVASVMLWDITAPHLARFLPMAADFGDVTALAFSPDGRILAVANVSRAGYSSISLWDMTTNPEHVRLKLEGHKGEIRSMAFRPDGKVLASGSLDDSVILWDVASGQKLEQRFVGTAKEPENSGTEPTEVKGIESVAWSRDSTILACGDRDSVITLWDSNNAANEKRQISTQHVRAVASLVFSPDNKTLASGGYNGEIYLWDVGRHQADQNAAPSRLIVPSLGRLKITDQTLKVTLVFSPDGNTLYSNGYFNSGVLLWDMNEDSWKREACKIANRPLTKDEWQQFIGEDVPYEATCPQFESNP